MEWLDCYHNQRELKEKLDKARIKQKMLTELKKKHFEEKKQEQSILKKRLEFLENELQNYR